MAKCNGVKGKYNRPWVLTCFVLLCGVSVIWGNQYTMAILAIAAQPVNNYCQIKGANKDPEPNGKVEVESDQA